MSLLERFRKKGRVVPPYATFAITQRGEEKIQDLTGDTRHRILVALQTNGSSTLEEISRSSGISRGRTEKMLPIMVQQRLIQYVSSSSDDTLL